MRGSGKLRGMDTQEMGRPLREVFATVPDPRSRHGQRHPVAAMLAQATAAMLEGANSLAAIHHWGRAQPAAVVRALGYTRERTPSLGTLHTVFARLDAAAVEAALGRWAQQSLGRADRAIAIDGKAVRGTFGADRPGLLLIAAYTHEAGLGLAQAGGAAGRP